MIDAPAIDINRWLTEHPRLTIAPWTAAAGKHSLDSRYVELYWLPILGPASILAARRIGLWLTVESDGFQVDLEEFAVMLGLGRSTSKNSAIYGTLGRLERFGLAVVDGDRYLVRTAFPPLSEKQWHRLPATLRRATRTDAHGR